MIYDEIKQVFPSTSSLTVASFFDAQDQEFLQSAVTLSNFPFGKSKRDAVQFSVFTFDGDLVTSSYFVPSGKYLPFTKSYYDVFNRYVEYSYSTYQSDFVIVGNETKSVFIDVADQLNTMGVQEGNYKVGIQLIRDVVGDRSNPSQQLIVDSISPSRTEITVVPVTTKYQVSDVNTEFYAFSSGSALMRDVVDDLVSGISKPEIYNIFYRVANRNKDGASRFMFDYGFRQGVDAVNFLIDVYYGVKKGSRRSDGQFSTVTVLGIFDQFANWSYQNYNKAYTFQEIRDQYYSLFHYIIDKELNGYNTKKPDDYEQVLAFLSEIYYTEIFYPVVSQIEVLYSGYISGYFKNYINLGDDRLLAVLNTKVLPATNQTQHEKLALKLDKPLPTDVVRLHRVWIENTFASQPILQNVYFYSKPQINLTTLRGPNFLAKFENEGNSTEMLSLETLIGETGSLYDEVLTKLEKKTHSQVQRTVDYRYFENFVNFSTANLRLQAYSAKLDNLDQLNKNIQDLDVKLVLNPTDEYYLRLKKEAEDEIDRIKASFDGYETFLYNNDAWYLEHTKEYNGVSSASLYDAENQNSLINNLPAFMLEDSNNNDYTKFVGMVGHFFDNLSQVITQFTDKSNTSSGPNDGISLDFVYDALVSMGWDPEISRENLPLLLGSFSKSDFSPDSPLYDKVGTISENDRNKLIWKRILNTLPFIYKTKGTAASINAIISCFGIPKNLLKIKEYGSIDQTANLEDQGMYVFDETKYSPEFVGEGEYFQIPWTGSTNTLEFDVRFNPTRTSTEGQVFRLVSCENNWVLGVYRDRGMEWGRVFWSIDDGSGSINTTMSEKAPLFDGNTYSILFRRNDLGRPIDYPTEYELVVKKSDAERIVFTATGSTILSGSYNNVYQSGSNLYVGNYHQSTASLNIDPEAFWGNIDEIKTWEISVDNTSFDAHVLHKGAYNYTTPDTMVDKLLARVSFNHPIDLYNNVGSASFANIAFRADFPELLAVNFPPKNAIEGECDLEGGSLFPYQFSVNTITQAVKVSTCGSQMIRSNKITHVDPKLLSPLSPTGRSTQRAEQNGLVDSNKVGVFFSPIDIQNEEILKFFGNYNFGELIGDPKLVYQSSYRDFERFREIYYNQGFGVIDYQSFMNIVRAYFDKAMFKYIETLVPARSKLATGILIEPSILERPKLQLKPVVKENISQGTGRVKFSETVKAKNVGQPTASISFGHGGTSILNDVNHRLYVDAPDKYGIGAYADKGVYYYNNDYYRVDVVREVKAYQVQRDCTLPKSSWNDYQRNINLNGSVDTLTSSYYKLNLVRLPTITQHPFTASWISVPSNPTSFYFSGSISYPLAWVAGDVNVSVVDPHTIYGMLSGPINGFRDGDSIPRTGFISTAMLASGSYHQISSSVNYVGYFDNIGGNYTFEGTVELTSPPSLNATDSSHFHFYLHSGSPTSSIYLDLMQKTSQANGRSLFTDTREIANRKAESLKVVPSNREMLSGYFSTHYKYKKQVFSQKEINSIENSYDQNGKAVPTRAKWKRNSQSKKTTVDSTTGNLNNSEPVERKTT